MGQSPDVQDLLKQLEQALATADLLGLSFIGCHIDRARAEVEKFVAENIQADLGSTSAAR